MASANASMDMIEAKRSAYSFLFSWTILLFSKTSIPTKSRSESLSRSSSLRSAKPKIL